MTATDLQTQTHEIVLDEIFPHPVAVIWKSLTTPELMGRWMMPPEGFAAIEGTAFTFTTTPAGKWDGLIRCQVLDVIPYARLSYSWKGGDEANTGYGSPLDTVVTWTLTAIEAGTRVQLVHSGFVLPVNETAYKNMSDGWTKVVKRLEDLTKQTN